jgi:hypothetical protein
MQMSKMWSRQTLKHSKGNHRRIVIWAQINYGVIRNTYDTPTRVEAL